MAPMRTWTFTEPKPARGPRESASSSTAAETSGGRVTNVHVSRLRASQHQSFARKVCTSPWSDVEDRPGSLGGTVGHMGAASHGTSLCTHPEAPPAGMLAGCLGADLP